MPDSNLFLGDPFLGGDGGGSLGYALGVATLVARDAIPAVDRAAYMSVYVYETDRWYTLIGGITNADWQLRDLARKVTDRPGVASPIQVTTGGSDVNGSGSVGAPYATISRALLDLGTERVNTNINIQLGPGVFVPPDTWTQANWVTVVGTTSTFDSGTVSSVVTWGGLVAFEIDLSITGVYALDALRRRFIRIVVGGTTIEGWIYENDATAAGVTRVRMSSNQLAITPVPAPGNVVTILNLDTTVRDATGTIASYIGNTQLNFRGVIVEGAGTNNNHFFVSTDKVEFVGCLVQNVGRWVAGQSGGLFLNNCYYYANGQASAILLCETGGQLRLNRGTVVDGSLSAQPVRIGPEANLRYIARTTFYQLAGGIVADSAAWAPVSEGDAISPTWLFAGTCGGIVWNGGPGVAGQGRLPTLLGSVTSNYAVTAQRGAHLSIRGNSSLQALSGILAVSADNGLTNVAQYFDNTVIEGGNVPSGGYTAVRTVTTPATVVFSDQVILVDAAAGPVSVQLPAISLMPNRSFTVKKIDVSANLVTVLPAGGQTIDGAASFVIASPYDARTFNSGGTVTTAWSVT
jgi:hypothetical protein